MVGVKSNLKQALILLRPSRREMESPVVLWHKTGDYRMLKV